MSFLEIIYMIVMIGAAVFVMFCIHAASKRNQRFIDNVEKDIQEKFPSEKK